MVSRKRARAEMEIEELEEEPTLLQKIRNQWEFASLMQYLFLFGKAVKLDDIDVEDFEEECLKPTHSDKLSDLGLALLKFVSSHRGLTPELFDEYTRRQYTAKAPNRNPFGTDETPNKFSDFDIATKLRVLHQLSTWTLHNPDRIRERMSEKDETQWRMEPQGYDSQGRQYFTLDDNRLYRRTDPPLPEPPAKPKSKPKGRKSKGSRASKRRKVSTVAAENSEVEEDDTMADKEVEPAGQEDDGLGGMKWELLAITLDDYNAFIDTIRRSKDADEKFLCRVLREKVLPIIEGAEEDKQRKEARRLKELENVQKLATAKRSSRIQSKMEKQKGIDAAEEAERKKQADLAMARKEHDKQQKMEEARETRMVTREQRLKEREVKRILHEEELARLAEDSKKVDSNEARMSERHLKAEMEKRQKELEKLNQEDDWFFDCSVCGVHGENIDDGSHSIACEKCNVWQHSACHGIKQEAAERDDFHFLCNDCKRKAIQPKIPPLKFRMNASPMSKFEEKLNGLPIAGGQFSLGSSPRAPMAPMAPMTRPLEAVHIPPPPATTQTPRPGSQQSRIMDGPNLSPQGQSPGPPGTYMTGGAYCPPQNSSLLAAARPTSAGIANGHDNSNGIPNGAAAYARFANGAVHGPVHNGYQQRSVYDPHVNGFSRMSPQSSFGSPSKPSSASPRPNGHGSPQMNPYPTATPRQTQPSNQSPAPHSGFNMAAHLAKQTLAATSPGFSPAKHDTQRPSSSHSLSERPIFPPVAALSPNLSAPNLTPPTKKATPVSSQEYQMGSPNLQHTPIQPFASSQQQVIQQPLLSPTTPQQQALQHSPPPPYYTQHSSQG